MAKHFHKFNCNTENKIIGLVEVGMFQSCLLFMGWIL